MDKREWERIERIIDKALEYHGQMRTNYINKRCGNDQQLRDKVTEFLTAIKESKGFLEEHQNN